MKRNRKPRDRYTSGFTLIELLVVTIIVGILSSIVAPSFLSFANNQRVNSAQTRIFQAIKVAQSDAKIRKVNTASGRTKITFTLPASGQPRFRLDNVRINSGQEQILDTGVEITSITETQAATVKASPSTVTSYALEFDAKGFPISSSGSLAYPICINLKVAGSSKTRWISIRTILGGVSTGSDTPCNQT